MKKTAVLLILSVIFSFSIPRRDLRSTEQVAGIALDMEEGKIRATFEFYKAEPQKPIGSEKEVVSTVGGSLTECIDSAFRTFGKELFAADAAALLINGKDREPLLKEALAYYARFSHDQMDLPVFFTQGKAGAVFGESGAVLSDSLVESAKKIHRVQTIRDLMNQKGSPVWIRGEGRYEILS